MIKSSNWQNDIIGRSEVSDETENKVMVRVISIVTVVMLARQKLQIIVQLLSASRL